MELLLTPFKVLRREFGALLIPSIPILILLVFIFISSGGIQDSTELLVKTDYYLGGDIQLSAADLTAYNDISANMQLPLIRLGGIAERTNIDELFGWTPDPIEGNLTQGTNESNITGAAFTGIGASNFLLAFIVIFLGFMSYAMVSRVIHSLRGNHPVMFGVKGVNKATIIIGLIATFLMLFISSFYLAGLKLLVIINFGILFTFIVPYASTGMPLGESIYRGFKFATGNTGRVIVAYIGSMGAAIMVPIGLLLFTTPLIVNLPPEQETLVTLLKVFLGLFSIVIVLFYQMALCASVVFDKEDLELKKTSSKESS